MDLEKQRNILFNLLHLCITIGKHRPISFVASPWQKANLGCESQINRRACPCYTYIYERWTLAKKACCFTLTKVKHWLLANKTLSIISRVDSIKSRHMMCWLVLSNSPHLGREHPTKMHYKLMDLRSKKDPTKYCWLSYCWSIPLYNVAWCL